MTLPFGVRVIRKSWYSGLITLAGGALLLTALLLYAFQMYSVGPTEGAVSVSKVKELTVHPDLETDQIIIGEARAGAVTEDPAAKAEPLSLELILQKYRTVSDLSKVGGMILHGIYVEDERQFTMNLMVKSPSLVRKTLKDGSIKMICSYDGNEVHVAIEGDHGEMHRQSLGDELYQHVIILEGAVLALASNELPDVLAYKREPDQTYEGQLCWVLRRRISTQQSMIHLLDAETGVERVRFVTFMHNGEQQQLSLHLSDYRKQGGGYLPFAYTLKFNGKLRGEVKLDSIQLNPGLGTWMFQFPESK